MKIYKKTGFLNLQKRDVFFYSAVLAGGYYPSNRK